MIPDQMDADLPEPLYPKIEDFIFEHPNQIASLLYQETVERSRRCYLAIGFVLGALCGVAATILWYTGGWR